MAERRRSKSSSSSSGSSTKKYTAEEVAGMAYKGPIIENRNSRRSAKRDTAESQRRSRRVYGAFDRSAARIGRGGKRGYANAQAGLAGGLQGLTSLLGLSGSAAGGAVAGDVMGSIGGRGMADISNIQARDQMWNSSMRRQGVIENTTLQRQYEYNLQRNLQELREQMQSLQASKEAEMAKARFEAQQLAEERAREEAAAAEQSRLIAEWIAAMKSGGNGGGGGQPGTQPGPVRLDSAGMPPGVSNSLGAFSYVPPGGVNTFAAAAGGVPGQLTGGNPGAMTYGTGPAGSGGQIGGVQTVDQLVAFYPQFADAIRNNFAALSARGFDEASIMRQLSGQGPVAPGYPQPNYPWLFPSG